MRTIKNRTGVATTNSKIMNVYTFASRVNGTGAADAADPCRQPLGHRAPWWVTL